MNMHIRTIRMREIVMTSEEHARFIRLMEKAAEGHTSHSANETMDDGSVLQVTVDDAQAHHLRERQRKNSHRPEPASRY